MLTTAGAVIHPRGSSVCFQQAVIPGCGDLRLQPAKIPEQAVPDEGGQPGAGCDHGLPVCGQAVSAAGDPAGGPSAAKIWTVRCGKAWRSGWAARLW